VQSIFVATFDEQLDVEITKRHKRERSGTKEKKGTGKVQDCGEKTSGLTSDTIGNN